MTTVAISALPTAGSLTGTEVFPLVQSSTKHLSMNALLAWIMAYMEATYGITPLPSGIIYDTFTAADDTELVAHTPEAGSSWAMGSGLGSSSLTIVGNLLGAQATFGVPCIYHNNTTGLPTDNFRITMVVAIDATNGWNIAVARDVGDGSVENVDRLLFLTRGGGGAGVITIDLCPGSGGRNPIDVTSTLSNTTATIVVERASGTYTLKINGTTIDSTSSSLDLTGKIGFQENNSGAGRNFQMNSFLLENL